MRISIIVPSYNQPDYIEETLINLTSLKNVLKEINVELEILLFDNRSNDDVQRIIEKYKGLFDYVEIKKDKGQYDAINKGILRLTGDYWTWLNTDDLIDVSGCLKAVQILKHNGKIDYIYGNVSVVDQRGKHIKDYRSGLLSFDSLLNNSSSINQPGSFFRTSFTRKIGLLKAYHCCFDYEYILRIFNNNGYGYYINEVVSYFRLYTNSKSGGLELQFINEQLSIKKAFKGKFLSNLTFNLYKRKVKAIIKARLL